MGWGASYCNGPGNRQGPALGAQRRGWPDARAGGEGFAPGNLSPLPEKGGLCREPANKSISDRLAFLINTHRHSGSPPR